MNTQQEHEAIKAYFATAGLTCKYLWTGGKTDNPAGLTDWYWDLGTTTQNITYFDWADGEPNNYNRTIHVENTIIVDVVKNFVYFDVGEDPSSGSWAQSQKMCFMCEVDLLQALPTSRLRSPSVHV